MIQFGFECGYVCFRVGALCGENLLHEGDDGLLLLRRHVGDGEVFPVVRVEVDVAAAIGHVAGMDGAHGLLSISCVVCLRGLGDGAASSTILICSGVRP